MGNVIVVNAGKSNAHSPGSIAFVVWIAFSKSVKNHIARSSEYFSSSTTWTECFRAFLNFEITSMCSGTVIVSDVTSHNSTQMVFAEDDYMVQTFTPD